MKIINRILEKIILCYMKLLKVKLDFYDFFFNIRTFIELHVFVVFFLKIVRVNFYEMKEL